MGKTANLQEIPIDLLVPYERNAKQHPEEQLEKLQASIREFGFVSPCLIDKDYNIIAGHGRVMAAKQMGLESVPCVLIEGLTEEQRRAYILADNRLTELGGWDMEIVEEELLTLGSVDIEITGFTLDIGEHAWFSDHDTGEATDEDDEEYKEFLEKFEAKHTTDDCYTPGLVYEAVAEWVAKEYGVSRSRFVRPFYPGGDYQNEKYKKNAIVVDNPPFSILAEIITFYHEHGIKFFLFAPTLTLFSSSSSSSCAIPTAATVVYDNGAVVNTSFLTNLEDEKWRVRTAGTLQKAVQDASDEEQKGKKKELPKYSYPDNVITSAMVARWSKYGIDFRLSKAESISISALDAQREEGKAIFGKGYLLSERAAAERAAAERAAAERAAAERAAAERAAATRWPLSEREKDIIAELSKAGEGEN